MLINYRTDYKLYDRFGGYERGYDVIKLNVLIYTPPRIVQMEKNRSNVQHWAERAEHVGT